MAKIVGDVKLDFSDVLILPKMSKIKSRNDVSLIRSFSFKNRVQLDVIPIFCSNMSSILDFGVAKIFAKNKMMSAVPKHYRPDDWLSSVDGLSDEEKTELLKFWSISCGISEADLGNVREICGGELGPLIKIITIDVANGYQEQFAQTVRKMREEFPDKIIMAGNVVTADMVEELLQNGADIIKIGIGPGSVCVTRSKTGVGYPQLSCILDTEKTAHDLGGLICSDGGCQSPGDFAKAFGGGADFVMSGGLFAGHLESPGEIITDSTTGQKYKEFFGMASTRAQMLFNGGLKEYRASEGKTVRIPLRGSINETISDLLGGLRSSMSYTGSNHLADFPKNVTFIRVNNQLNNVFGK